MRLLARAAAPARALRVVGAPTSFRVVAIPTPSMATPQVASTSSLGASSSRAFSTTTPVLKKGGGKKGGKKGKEVAEDDEDDTPKRGKDKGGKKGGKKGKNDDAEADASLSAEDIAQIADKTKAKMDKAVDWAKGIVYDGVQRGRGHVSPGRSTLAPCR